MSTARLVAALLAAIAIGASTTAHAQQNPPAGWPPADQPLIEHFPRPTTIAVEGGAGIVGFLGGAGSVGPAWNVRVTGALSDRFSIEGNYIGSTSTRVDTNSSLLMTSIDAGFRYNILPADAAPMQPFVVGGIGYAGFMGEYGDPFTVIVPISVGAERMLTENIKVGARFAYRPAFFDAMGAPPTAKGPAPGADTWSLLAQVGGGF